MFKSENNFYGGRMLAKREIHRFLKVYHQTIISPIISALIFLSVFTLAIGEHQANINGIPFINFMGYGLIIMTILQTAFANSASSLAMSKIIGYVNDILMPPFSPNEIIFAYCAGSIARGLSVGLLLSLTLCPFIDYTIHSWGYLIFFSLSAVLMLALLGMFTGIYSETFDQMSAITNYLITPLSFLSGTFYSVKRLPEELQIFNQINPFFYIIDGFRYGLTGVTDGNIFAGVLIVTIVNIALLALIRHLITIGWRLKN